MSQSARGAKDESKAGPETNASLAAPMSARGAVPMSSRGAPPLSARGKSQNQAEEKGPLAPQSARGEEVKLSARDTMSMTARVDAMDTGRDYMSTARMHTALAALTAERSELLNKLAFIDSTLEAEGKKKLMKTRGFMKPSHIGAK